MKEQLTSEFIVELFAQCFTSKSFAEIVSHHLKYEFLPTEATKLVYKDICDILELEDKLTTIGNISQRHSSNKEVVEFLKKVKNVKFVNQKDELLSTLESYLKESMFVKLHEEVTAIYNKDEHDEAIRVLATQSAEIQNFSIKKQIIGTVFKDFKSRNVIRSNKAEKHELKIPTGIHAFDFYTKGGPAKGTSFLALGRSGGGKSMFLKWLGINAARYENIVIHFQAEGTEAEVYDNYDAAWTGVNTSDIEIGFLPDEKIDGIDRAHKDMLSQKGEIFVKASEKFDEMSLQECRDFIFEVKKITGRVDLVLFDYLELFTIRGVKFSTNESGERRRREMIANKITNIATEFNVVTVTATQANDIKPEKFNDPDFYMTRSDISEFKGALKPFSYFITLNQTDDESDAGVSRIYIDKLRKYKSNKIFTIAQAMDKSRFYDSKKSLIAFWNEKTNKNK